MRTLLFITLFLLPVFGYTQSLQGVILDNYQLPLPGVYVVHTSSDNHTHTKDNGTFNLSPIQSGDTIQISFFGFEAEQIVIQDINEKLEISMTVATFELDQIIIGQDVKSINFISDIDLKTNPVNSSQEILRKVPGLFIGQHAGGGKAEQIFLRGFDIDHGTDITITADGLPVNMVSHAHGQGYADLHFIIPETIKKIDFGKGPYYADKGNFATAGYVDFQLKEGLENSLFSIEAGRFNTLRNVGLFNLLQSEKHNAYVAAEYMLSDGPFESPQNFSRLNLMGKYTAQFDNLDKLSILISHFDSRWDASGQIPNRMVEEGAISRFGAIDDTEGGHTGRTNIALNFNKNIDKNTFIKNRLFYSLYDFELYSNFTFFLNDPVNGDQIKQYEQRQMFGAVSEWNHVLDTKKGEILLQAAIGFRYDNSDDNELSRTLNRKTTLSNIQLGDIDESNLYAYLNSEFELGNLLINPGIRVDYFKFNYVNALDSLYSTQSQSKWMATPNLNIIYNQNRSLQFFFKMGTGFHSNDTRLVLDTDKKDILPLAYGADLGAIWKPTRRTVVNTALWYLFLEQEFVYVGDEGVVEPSGKTRRLGIDLDIRHQLFDWLFADADLTYTLARSIEEPDDAAYIPLAPVLTATGGLNVRKDAFSAGIQFRYLGDRAANEDKSIIAKGYNIIDLNTAYQWKKLRLGINIENLFNVAWNETQFATESRLFYESEPIEEIHFTPGTPIFIKGSIQYQF